MPFPVPVTSLVGRTAEWARTPGDRRTWQLTAGGVRMTTLRWPKLLSSRAEGETATGRWTFRPRGVLRRRYVAEADGAEAAVYEMHWTRGRAVLDIPGQRRFRLERDGWLGRKWWVRAQDGSPVLRFDVRMGWRFMAEVTVLDEARRYDELPLLLVMTWYALVQQRNEAAAAAGGG